MSMWRGRKSGGGRGEGKDGEETRWSGTSRGTNQ